MADQPARRGPGPSEVPHELLLDVFNSVSDGVVAVDRDLRVTAINRSALETLGLTLQEAMGQPSSDILVTERAPRGGVLADTLSTGRAETDRDILLEDRHGQQIPVLLSTRLVRSPDGRVLGGVATFRNVLAARELVAETSRARPFQDIVTGDPTMRRLFAILPTIARADSSCLVRGETGTGKGLVVRTIHNLSPRHRAPLVTVNCAALPETLLEAELFGVKAGAYTGANRDRPGRLEAAEGGMLFLDEIGDMSLGVQVKLLRVLQERVYERVGDIRPRTCDVRFIAATHRDLEAMVEEGSFRRDLYFRINVLNVEIPPLRERKGDIPLLAQRFIDRLSQTRGKKVHGVSSRVLEILTVHDYPGNIRELENVIEHAWVMCESGIIEPRHLPDTLQGAPATEPATGEPTGRGLPRLEADYIRQVLRRHGGHRGAAARELGIHRTTLQRKIQRLGIHLPPGDGRSTARSGPDAEH